MNSSDNHGQKLDLPVQPAPFPAANPLRPQNRTVPEKHSENGSQPNPPQQGNGATHMIEIGPNSMNSKAESCPLAQQRVMSAQVGHVFPFGQKHGDTSGVEQKQS
jgi:hypothetical protein